MSTPVAERTSALRVADIMQADPITIIPDASVRELAQLLVEHEISGVPVVESGGAVAGVVSIWDIARLIAESASEPSFSLFLGGGGAPASSPSLRPAFYRSPDLNGPPHRPFIGTSLPGLLERHRVRDIMTPAVFHVREGATLPELARFLLQAKIHRALVMDGGHLRGIVTSSDVLHALAEPA